MICYILIFTFFQTSSINLLYRELSSSFRSWKKKRKTTSSIVGNNHCRDVNSIRFSTQEHSRRIFRRKYFPFQMENSIHCIQVPRATISYTRCATFAFPNIYLIPPQLKIHNHGKRKCHSKLHSCTLYVYVVHLSITIGRKSCATVYIRYTRRSNLKLVVAS